MRRTSVTKVSENRVFQQAAKSFKYDPFGRRIYKSSSAGTSVFAYDGDNLVEETNSAGAVVARYEQTHNIDEPLAMLRSAATSYYHADGRENSPRCYRRVLKGKPSPTRCR